MTSCVLDQNPSHQLCRSGEEVRPILPPHPLVVDKSYVGFIHQRGCLETVIRPLTPHVTVRKPAELRVEDRRQTVERPSSPSLHARSISLTSSACCVSECGRSLPSRSRWRLRLVLASRRTPTATLRPRGTWLRESIVFQAGRACLYRCAHISWLWAAKSSEPTTSSAWSSKDFWKCARSWQPTQFPR